MRQARRQLGDSPEPQFTQALLYIEAECARARGDLAPAAALVASGLAESTGLVGPLLVAADLAGRPDRAPTRRRPGTGTSRERRRGTRADGRPRRAVRTGSPAAAAYAP